MLLTAALPFLGEQLPPRRSWTSIAIAGFLMAVIGNGGVVWAEQYVASGLAAVVVAMVPFWVVLIEAVLPSGERLTRRTVAGLAVGFAGIVVLVWPQLFGGGQEGRQFLFGVISLYQTKVNTKMTFAMERLAVIAAVTLPITAIASVLGMNLIFVGHTHWTSLLITLAVMLTVSALLLRWARKQGWW